MRKPTIVARLNLLPVMNLVTILIPLLLMGATLMNLAVVDTTLPAICKDCAEPGPEVPLRLILEIAPDGLTLSGADRVLDDGRIPCTDDACRSPGSYDFDALQRKLVLVKEQYPDNETLILVPDERTPYEVIIGAMDAARQTPTERTLFPQVTISGGA